MSKKIVLHIGAAKTGSSAIQSFLRINRQALEDHGIIVPDDQLKRSGKVTGEHVFAIQELLTGAENDQLEHVLHSMLESVADDETVVISAENLSNLGAHKGFKGFNGFLGAYDVRAILYIRRQDELLTSAWQQWYSKIETDMNAWIIKSLSQFGHWDRVIQNWESVLGEGSVTVRIFERADLVDGDLLLDFLACLDANLGAEDFTMDVGHVNPSYSDFIVPLVAGNKNIFCNVHDNAFYNMVGALSGTTYSIGPKMSLLSRDQRESVLFHYKNINQRVCRDHFPGRTELFAPIDHSKYEYLSIGQLQERQLRFLTELMFQLGKERSGS